MTTRRTGDRSAVSHFSVVERLATRYGAFTLVEHGSRRDGRTRFGSMRSRWDIRGGQHAYGAPRVMHLAVRKDGITKPPKTSMGLNGTTSMRRTWSLSIRRRARRWRWMLRAAGAGGVSGAAQDGEGVSW